LPDAGKLAGEIKHLNGLCVARGHVCHGISQGRGMACIVRGRIASKVDT
jgi:hypothetical protein